MRPPLRLCYEDKSFLSFFLFSLISLIADGHHYHPACGHKGFSYISPVHALHFFFYRDASSALLQLVNQWLNFTYSRSHAFRYERKNTNPTLVRIEPATSALAGVQVTYYNIPLGIDEKNIGGLSVRVLRAVLDPPWLEEKAL